MIKKIMVPVDGSTRSEEAIRKALSVLEGKVGGSILLLRVLELSENSPFLEPIHLDSAKERERRQVSLELDTLKEEYSAPHCHIETRLVSSNKDVAETISEHAELEGVDLIAITTHGRTGLQRLFLGSVAEKIVKLAPCSVLIARQPQ
jgi:nucleotide-binding universal stress UspA family protein